MADLEFRAGEIIFRQGYPSDDAYVIDSGKVEIFTENPDGTETRIATLDAGQMFGEYGPLDEAPRSASARALGDTTLSIVPL